MAAGAVAAGPTGAPIVQSVSGSTDSATVAAPEGVTEGDLLLGCFIGYVSTTGTVSPPAGWTAIGSMVNTDLTPNDPNAAQVFAYKIAGASEPASYTFSIGGGAIYPCANILRISGAGASPTFDGPTAETHGFDLSREFGSLTVTEDLSLQILHSIGYSGAPETPAGWFEAAINDGVTGVYYREVDAGAAADGVIVETGAAHFWMNRSIAVHPGA